MTGTGNFVEVCESSCIRHGSKLAYRYFHRSGEETLSFAALRESAIALASRLQRAGGRGDRALIICPQGMDYVRALWGCLYSGLVAVPAYAPRNTQHFDRLRTIVRSAEASVVLLTSRQLHSVREIDKSGLLAGMRWVVVDEPAGEDGGWIRPSIAADDLALLQYTSGSTTAPRGVMVSHRNLLANQRMIERAYRHHADTVSVLWIPLFHDMGLMALLQGVHGGFSSHLMSPLDFLASPHRWLEAISELRATATAAPDFAYRLCVEKITGEQLAALDLSTLVTAISGSEPISASNLDAFANRFAASGFRRQAFFPSYGLAEATLLVSGGKRQDEPRLVDERVACGAPADECEVVVVDEHARRCAEGRAGELWVKGPNVAAGYWNDPEATRETFGAVTADGDGPFLRTGDLGFVHDGEVVVTGRLKDLIIIRGANYYPNDLEQCATSAHPQLVAGACAAFLDAAGALCVVAEVRKSAPAPGAVEEAIVRAVSESFGLLVRRVVLVKQGTIPRTSSGKIQRWVTKEALEAEGLHVVHRSAHDLSTLLARELDVPFEQLPRHKSLAALGLDSVAAMQLRQRLETQLGAELPPELFFAERTIEELANEIARRSRREHDRAPSPEAVTHSGAFAATVGQVALWAIQQRDPASAAYNEGFFARVEGPLDLDALQKSLQVLAARHPALRTTFRETQGQLWQDVAAELAVAVPRESAEDALAAARAVLDTPFDLTRETWRCRVIRGADGTLVSFAVHHILFDMLSFGIFLEELTATYRALVEQRPLPYSAVDQGHAWIGRSRAPVDPHELESWRAALDGAPATSRFPPSRAGDAASIAARRHRFAVPRSSLAELRAFAQAENVTLSQLLTAGFFLLLGRYSGQDDVVLGIPLLGRADTSSLGALGYFVNMGPVRVRGIDDVDVRGLIHATRRALEDAQRAQSVPFASIVEAHGGESPVQTSFSLLSSHLTRRPDVAPFVLGMAGGRLQLGSAVLHSCEHDRLHGQWDLACTVIEWGDELHGTVDVRAGLYDEASIERLTANYVSLLGTMARSAQTPARAIPVVGENERLLLRRHLRRGPAQTKIESASVVEWFRRAAAQHSDRVAVSGPAVTRTYAELEEESDRIAASLVDRGLQRGGRVALAFADRATQTIAELSVLKAAGTFVPLDLGHPSQRLAACVRDSRAAWILSDDASAARMESVARADGAEVLRLRELAAAGAAASLPRPAGAGDIAYCIYTSGSTGVPKGVSIPHRGLQNLVEWHVGAFGVDRSARASLIAGAAFDVAVWEVWPYLCAGGTLVEPPYEVKSVAGELARWIREQRLTHSFVPTPLAELLLEELDRPDLGELRYLFTAGDRLHVAARPGSAFQLINAYGPTENSVITTAGPVVSNGSGLPDIGKPISNQDLYILDRHGNEVPLGVCGELYISGAGLAREYHDRPARTAERFVPNIFAGEPGVRMYASGDLVRLSGDGRIHFVARNDDQVKIRGHRVELGEIEAVLMRHPAIRQCKVVLQESPALGKWIAAYVSASDGTPAAETALRAWLEERLPGAMVPAAFRWLPELPVDANGKIDRRQLPPIAEPASEPRAITPFAAPLEEEIARLFAEITGAAGIGRDDDFFALGGHSLLAGKLVQRVHASLGVTLAMADVFRHPRVDALAAIVRAKREAQAVPGPEPLPRPEGIPLGSAQRRLWFLQRVNPKSTDYNMTGMLHLRGRVDLAALEAAFQRVVARHEALRTRFPEDDGVPRPEVLPSLTVPLECVTLDGAGDAEVQRILRGWEAEPFSLEHGPLVRTRFLRTASDEGWLFVSVHHIVADGRSLQILLRELSASYRGEAEPPRPLQYGGAAHAGESDAEDIRYWMEHLTELPPQLAIPSLPPASVSEAEPPGDELRVPLPLSLADEVRQRAMAWKTTEFNIYLATLAALLAKTSGEDRFLVGTAYEGRNRPELQDVVGFFVNVLPILVEQPDSGDFRGLLDLVRTRAAKAIEHSHASYEHIVQALRSARDGAALDLIQAMFDFEQFTPERLDLGAAQAFLAPRADTTAKFDLTFRVRIGSDAPSIALNYRRHKYGRVVADSLLSSYLVLLRQVIDDPAARLADLRLVDDATAARLLRQGAGPERALPSRSCVRRFAAIARAHPGRLALVGAGGAERLTYGELDAAANRLARLLRERGLTRGGIGAVGLEPGPSFVIAALAILKLGAAYVAVDPRYPEKRRQAILDDCDAAVFIDDDEWLAQPSGDHPAEDPDVTIDAEDPVYVVYTSGTTGAPKGVVVPERGLANLCQWHARTYGLEGRGEEVRAAQTASIGFDAAVWEIWPYLLEGASVWFAPAETRTSSREMARWLTDARITHAFLSTPLAHELLGDGWRGSADLKFLLTGGDRLTAWALCGATYELINHYGPSENAVVATAGHVAMEGLRLPPIGRPIDNVQALVLGRDGQLLPLGIAGELHLAGASLATGYRGDHESTGRKWIAHPFASDGARMYSTGDRVCWNEHGLLESLGRTDEQVKIRGVRIEPAEIVRALAAHAAVQSAIVKPVAHPVTGLHLAAYVALRPGATATADELRGELSKTLPPSMVPPFLIVLDAFPRTSNGKLDASRLPLPAWDAAPASRPLATATEHAIAAIWSSHLGVPVEDAGANFFSLGGHSLLAARAVAAIESELGRECPLQAFLASPTLGALAAHVDAAPEYRRIPRAKAGEKPPLSPLQRRLWLMQQFAPGSVDYNVVGAIELQGAIDQAALRRAVALLVERHAVLRTRIATAGGEPYQHVFDADDAFLSRVFVPEDASAGEDAPVADRIAALAREAYDLERGPLFRLHALQTDASRIVLAISVHHIIIDGWSVQVLLRDLFEIYRSLLDGKAPALPRLPIAYTDYSAWAARQLGAKEDELLSFWKHSLHGRPPAPQLPSRPHPGAPTGTGATTSFALGRETTARIEALAREQRVSLFELLFAAHVVWLYQLTRSTDLIVGAPFHQRGRPELEHLAGFFVNILPVRARFARSWTFREVVAHVQETMAAIQAHQELPFDVIAERADAGEAPLYRTMFDLRQEPPFAAHLGGLSVRTLVQHADAPLADLAVTVAQTDDGLTWSCTFRPERFSAGMIESWGANFRILLGGVLADVERPIRELPLRAAEPRRAAAQAPARSDETLLVQLARQVATVPSRPALTSAEESFTFLDLELASNQIAQYLRAQGIRPGATVALEARHALDSILTILGVMKAGALYVPIDTSLPAERFLELLADTGCEQFLAAEERTIPGFAGHVVSMARDRWQDAPRHLLGASVIPESPVYLAYTSGTTGEPKASVLSHRGISNYVSTVRERFRVTPDDRFLLFAPLSFDASLEEIFVPLSSGASLHVGPQDGKTSVAALVELCREAAITVLILPTAYWHLLAEHIAAVGAGALPTVRLISIGGEKALLSTVERWTALTDGGIELWNIYGPSECSVGCIVDRMDDAEAYDGRDFIPLRHPVANVELHVLDEHLDPVPPGVDGEVYVGGAGLGHGYHRRPALTAEKFIPNPFGAPGSRLYRTGDLVRLDPAGGMEFLGRTDFQVKIDGIRVEPGEVESCLERHPAVAKAVVMPRRVGTAENHLVAYVTGADTGAQPEAGELLAYLRGRLPAYMVPAALHVLDAFPLTTNQKIDRAALGELALQRREAVPAANETEALLLAAWRELLPEAGFGVTDELFSLGAGSLLVIRLITRIDVQTGVRLSVRDIFEHPTVRQLAELVERRRALAAPPIPRVERTEVPLSGAQARLWYLQQIEPQSSAYNVPNCLLLEGALERDALLAAIRTTIAGNESLRTLFQVRGDAPMQIVQSEMLATLEEHDLGDLAVAHALDRAAELGRTLLEQPFDLERGPLWRFHLVRVRPDVHVFISIFHHIVVDGWSVQLWNEQLARAYNGEAAAMRDERALQYRDFSEWQRQLLDGGERERQLAYWSRVLDGALPSLELPVDFVRPAQASDRGDVRSFRIDGALAARLTAFGLERQASLFMVLLGAYVSLLHRYSGQADLLVGIPAHGRERTELDEVIGFFVNTLVVRCRIRPDMPFTELLEQVKKSCLDALDHQDVPLEEIAARANAVRRGGRSEIFQTMFSFHEGARTGAEGLRDLRVASFDFAHRTAKFELSLAMWTTGDGVAGALEFRTDLFAGGTIERMAGHFENLLRDIAAQPSSPVACLNLLSPVEHAALVHAHDGAVLPLPGLLAHQLFEQHAAAHPERVAVTCGDEQLTYAELDRRANVVAHALLTRGARLEDRIVLLLGRDASYLVALLACLKSGTAFIPMDPDYPIHKRVSMIRQSAARFLLSDSSHRERIVEMELDLPLVDLDETLAAPLAAGDPRTRNPDVPLTRKSLAYVIHTSGSTGKPKGAMIEHGGMLNHLLSKVDGLKLTERDVVAEMATTTFDVSIWQYLVALLVGGRTAVIPGDAAWVPRDLLAELEREGVTIFESVPSHMKVILDELESAPGVRRLPRLRTYISNAEALTPALCRRWMNSLPHASIINTYGATECSDDTSHLYIDAPPSDEHPYLPIHGTLPNLTTYVLDELLQPVPVGVPGEVHIGGAGVGRGYADDPVRTAMSFLPDPFASEPGARFYRTGDIARMHPDGVLEFLGRADFQVKIRGQRVELGEIEATLRTHDNVRDVLVSATRAQHGGFHLIAYVVPVRHPAPSAQELQAFARTRLADHMVPAAVVFMDEFPLNDNGKVDRHKLPVLSDDELLHRHAFEPPSPGTERELADLWASVLEAGDVGALDGFFELGGHSLLAAELMIRIRNRFGVDILLREFFEHATVRALAALIDARGDARIAAPPAMKRYPAQPRYDLAPCQIPEWYAYQFDPASPVYNISVCDLFLRGELDRSAFLRAWQTILDRHDVLHVRFGYRDGKPFQTVDRRVVLRKEDVFLERLAFDTDEEVLAEANRLAGELGAAPFDFDKGPLFRLHLVTYGSNRHQLIFVVHHIVWDETSLINLTGELTELYNAFVERREPELPALQASYFDYVQWMHESLASGALDASKHYWLNLYRTVPPPLDLPTDHPRPDLMSYRGDAIETWLPRRVVQKLESFTRRNGVTLFMVKLALLDHYLHLMSGQDDFVIGCPIAGRAHPDFQPLLGLFATPMPIRCNIEAGMTFRELLRHVSARTLDAFDHFLYPSNQLIEQLSHGKDLSRPKLFSVMFGLQNDKTDVVGRLAFRGLELSFEKVTDTENKTSRFDLNFVVDQFGSDVKFSCIYNTDLFHRDTVALMLDNMTALLDAVLDDPDKPLGRYGSLGSIDAGVESGPAVDVDPRATMHGGFESQAARTPDRTAVVIGDERCTYAELNRRANQLARYIRSTGIEPGQPVAVLHEPSIELIVSLLAVLKAGCPYVPVAPDYPQSRVDAILRETNARAVLTTTDQEHRFLSSGADLIFVDDLAEVLSCYVADDPAAVDPGELAYILFTSGTTGQPRGIAIEHRGVANMFAAVQHEYALAEDDRVLFHTPITFDVAVQEIFWPLAFGATVVVAPPRTLRAAREIAALIERHAITFVQFVPAMLESLVDARRKGTISALPSLRQVICGGAVLSKALNDGFRAAFSAPLANHYGPTEVTVDASRFDCSQPFAGQTTPIGRPIANTNIFVLDEAGERVPRGIIGEIHVASPGLARGYLNDVARTAEMFIERDIDGVLRRLYKTGDLGRYDHDGLLHFHGRRDRQIKVRGNRVEVEEIVGVLASHPDIAGAAIRLVQTAREGGRLVAYIEQDAPVNQAVTPAGVRYAFTFEQRPELVEAAEAWLRSRRPLREEEERLRHDFPALQVVLTNEADEVVLAGHALPDASRDTLFVFDADDDVLLDAQRALARAHGFGKLVSSDRTEELSSSTPPRQPLTRATVREFLRQSLPDYMIPEGVHFVPAIPRTESGKVDEKRLPEPGAVAGAERTAAGTEMQKELAAIVRQVLGLDADVGPTDDFFLLGGQSLAAVELISEINAKYGSHVDLRAFYREPTVESLERLLTRSACTYSA